MQFRSLFFAVVCLAGLCALPSMQARAAGDAALLDQLTRPPLLAAVSLSSDGRFLVALHRKGDEQALVVWNADKGPDDGDQLPYRREDLNWLAWVGGGRLLISLKEHGLVLYDAHLARLRPLIDGGGPRPEDLPPVLLSALPDDPTSILMQWEDDAVPGYPAVYKVDAISGVSRKIVSAWKPVIRWWASPEGEVQLGEGFRDRRQVLFGRAADGSWATISDKDYFDDPSLSVLTVEAGGATALVLSGHASDTRALWRMDTRTGAMIAQLAGNARYDINAAILDPVTDLAVGATFVADANEEVIWQADHRARVEAMEVRLGLPHMGLFSSSRDGSRQMFYGDDRTGPVRYFMYDRDEDKLTMLPYDPVEDSWPLPINEGVWIPISRKAGRMHAVLSRPISGDTGRAVILVHGGPVKRVVADYDPLVAWLTANGYTVLQPNFRGSSGFGESWRRAGYGEWGRDMQDDVRTAAEWMIDNEYAKSGSMCVMGGSYGGYAALLSSVKDDDLFACAISLNGVTSLPHLISFLESHRFHALTVPRIKARLSDYILKRRSPLYRADLVRVPVLLLHSTNDNNVPYEQGEAMAKVLERLNKDVNFITLNGAEHQLLRPLDRRTYYQSALNFLDAHIGGHAAAGRK